jgi:choline dehydrogenase
MAFLSLQQSANNSNAVLNLARTQNPASLLPAGTHPDVLAGYAAQRNIIINNLVQKGAPIGSISWNTGPATSLYMLRPLSRGSVKIASNSILNDPLIDFGAAMDPTDIEFLLAVYKKNRQLMNAPDISVLGAQETSPAPGLTNDAAIKAAIKAAVQPTNAHQCCTLPMMDRNLGGVVSPDLRVYGTQRLSVVDASIWPFIIGGGPQATVYGNAEKVESLTPCVPIEEANLSMQGGRSHQDAQRTLSISNNLIFSQRRPAGVMMI